MAWYQSPLTESSPIISARVRLARNIKKYPFKTKLTTALSRQMVEDVEAAVKNRRTSKGERFNKLDPDTYSPTEKEMFLEKHIVSREFVTSQHPRGLLLNGNGDISIMVNEEDHLRIQAFCPSDDIVAAWEVANRADDLIERTLEYAFHTEYGYLTACPTNVGTGMRASFMVHLPMLEKTNRLKHLLPAIGKFGIAIRGLYGEGSESMGGIYQISNQITLGKSEPDIIQGLQSVAKNLIENELRIRTKMFEKHRLEITNNIYRAYGILQYGRKVSLKEAVEMLSEIRLGFALNLLEDLPRPRKNLYQIMMEIQPGHIIHRAGNFTLENISERQQDAIRADYLRSMFS